MGWQEAPELGQETSAGQPMPQGFMAAPEVTAPQSQAIPEPSMGEVALNAIPKGLANLLNTPEGLKHIMAKGLLYIPGADAIPGIKAAAEHPTNTPMDVATKMGLVDPAKNPQTGPQRIVDTAIQAAIGAAAIPAGGVMGAVKGAAIGATSGAAAQTTKELTGSDLLAIAVGVATPFAIRAIGSSTKQMLGNATRKQTLAESREAGYVVEPSSVRQPTSKLETIAGKASIAQEAATRNQTVTNGLAAKAIGLPEDTPLSMSVIEEVRKRAAVPYQEIDALSNTPLHASNLPGFPQRYGANLLDQLKQARADASAHYRHYDRSMDPSSLKIAKQQAALAEQLESNMERLAQAVGRPELVNQLRAARQLYARTYDIERALNLSDGNVSAPIIGRMFDQGRPLSGELRVIGKFAQAFPRVAREVENVPPSGVSGTDAAGSAVLGIGGAAAAGNPIGAVAGGLPLLRGPARNRVLSEAYQSGLLKEPVPPTPLPETAGRAGMVGLTQGNQE